MDLTTRRERESIECSESTSIDGIRSCPANLATANASDTSGAGKLLLVLAQSGEKLSEDCLFLNVWTKPQSGEKKKAVMIWIHGGGTQHDARFDDPA